MFQRHKLEKSEGKSYNETGVSHLLEDIVHQNAHAPTIAPGFRRDEGIEFEVC